VQVFAQNFSFAAAGFVNYFMWRHITNAKNKLAEPAIDPMVAKMAKARSLIVPCIFLLMMAVAYTTNLLIAVYIPMLIPIVLRIVKKSMTKK
jgi:hypothetical protein